MYLKQVFLKNCGPIDECAFTLPFDQNNNPKPLILVGENGAGKTIFLSYIVDALHEFFIQAGYKNLVGLQNTSNISLGHSMYKVSGYFNKKLRTENAFSSLIFSTGNGTQSGYLSVQDISIQNAKSEISKKFSEITYLSLPENRDNKVVSQNAELYEKEHRNGCFLFFPDYRQEQPIWINENLKQVQPQLMKEKTPKPLVVDSSQNENSLWLLDIKLDTVNENSNANAFLTIANSILQKIMKRTDVFIGHDSRTLGGVNRITIGFHDNGGGIALCPRINALSEGQSTLLNMFLTILRYTDLGESSRIPVSSGIVIIDEIENHLHNDLIANVLPDLIKMFPKIQFIITTHSPIFLLGMKETFGSDGFEIREMPTGAVINPEDYSQFQVMFDIVSRTKKIKELIDSTNKEKELIITEGQTDWMHIEHAFNQLSLDSFQFLQYTDTMGDSVLRQICQTYAKIPHTKPIICIFDSDNDTCISLHDDLEDGIKDWGNNVYSFCIPVPDFRDADPNISIEMYYPDSILKTETVIDGVKKCLYFNNELSYEKNHHCILNAARGNQKRRRIEDRDVVTFENPHNKPWIKTKKEFANEILADKIPGVNYEPFRLIHDKIKKIMQLTEQNNQN